MAPVIVLGILALGCALGWLISAVRSRRFTGPEERDRRRRIEAELRRIEREK